jgi:hypothetical protein
MVTVTYSHWTAGEPDACLRLDPRELKAAAASTR